MAALVAGCARCGQCCTAISIEGTKKFLRAHKLYPRDGEVMLKYWRRISKAEALRRLPGLSLYAIKGRYFYECTLYDAEAKLCTIHDDQPLVCSGFPWYGRAPWDRPADLLKPFPLCSYWHDVPRRNWPEGIEPLPDPNPPEEAAEEKAA